jgi:nucleoside-diphosphate-sugar epimerase
LLQAADLPMKDVSGSQRDLGRILITGARGFIGAALVRALAQNGETVTASDLAGDATDAADFRAATSPMLMRSMSCSTAIDLTRSSTAAPSPDRW